jgi:hypothetical protein
MELKKVVKTREIFVTFSENRWKSAAIFKKKLCNCVKFHTKEKKADEYRSSCNFQTYGVGVIEFQVFLSL